MQSISAKLNLGHVPQVITSRLSCLRSQVSIVHKRLEEQPSGIRVTNKFDSACLLNSELLE